MIDEITRGFISTMLQDLQFMEDDEACTEGREARTIEQVAPVTADNIKAMLAAWFARAEPYLAPSGYSLTYDLYEIGSDAYLTAAGHGVGFWDRPEKINRRDGDLISDMLPRVEPYVGDDGLVYICGMERN